MKNNDGLYLYLYWIYAAFAIITSFVISIIGISRASYPVDAKFLMDWRIVVPMLIVFPRVWKNLMFSFKAFRYTNSSKFVFKSQEWKKRDVVERAWWSIVIWTLGFASMFFSVIVVIALEKTLGIFIFTMATIVFHIIATIHETCSINLTTDMISSVDKQC